MTEIIDPARGSPSLETIVEEVRQRYSTMEEMTLSALRKGILTGALPPGSKLRQDRLAELLGVSRMPIRASLRKLEGEGLVILEAHRGAVVTALSEKELVEIYELRKLLEGFAIRRVIERITDEDVTELHRQVKSMEVENDTDRWIELREGFYETMYEIGEIPRTLKMIMGLRNQIGRYWLGRRIGRSDEEGHHELVELVRKRDSDGAVQWLEVHLDRVSEGLQRFMGSNEESMQKGYSPGESANPGLSS